MDNEKIITLIESLQDTLAKIDDPTDEKFSIVMGMLARAQKLKTDNDEACDKQNERQKKLDLERERLEKEFELRLKELEFKYVLEDKKIKDSSEEAANRRRAEKRNAIWDLIKILAQIVGYGALIAFTGKVEQGVIIGNHKWTWLQKFKA